jgi:hypothetical protein
MSSTHRIASATHVSWWLQPASSGQNAISPSKLMASTQTPHSMQLLVASNFCRQAAGKLQVLMGSMVGRMSFILNHIL